MNTDTKIDEFSAKEAFYLLDYEKEGKIEIEKILSNGYITKYSDPLGEYSFLNNDDSINVADKVFNMCSALELNDKDLDPKNNKLFVDNDIDNTAISEYESAPSILALTVSPFWSNISTVLAYSITWLLVKIYALESSLSYTTPEPHPATLDPE